MDMKQITLEMNYGDVVCNVAGRFSVNENKYICLIPLHTNNIWLFKLESEHKTSFTILPIEDKEEFHRAIEELKSIFFRIILGKK